MPHRCGIATFTHDLAASAGPHHVVALHPPTGPDAYPREVRHRIRRDTLADYHVVADALNASGTDVVSIQHEYGIWGGADGGYVLDFVRGAEIGPSSRRCTRSCVGRPPTSATSSRA